MKKYNQPKVKRKLSVKTLKKKLDDVFSLYIRLREKGKCYTCSIQKEIKKMDAGHYIKRQYDSLRFDERNVHCQCRSCNRFKGGMMDIYAVNLQRDYGIGILEGFQVKKKELKQWKVPELQEKIEYYKLQIEKLQVVK